MKRLFTLLCGALLTLSTMNAEVLLTEHFAQTTEKLADNDNVMANPIAATGWTNVSLSGEAIYVSQTKDLTYANYKSATDNTGSAWYKAVGKAVATPLSKSITLDGSVKSVFVAGIINVTSVGAYSQGSRDYIWTLGKGTSSLNNTSVDRFLRLSMRLGDGDNSFQLAISKLNEATNYQPWTGDLACNKNYLIVTEYRYVAGEKNDSVFLYINPGKDDFGKYTLTSKQDTLQSGVTQKGSISQSDAPTFGSMMLISVSSVKPTMYVDELKVATSWNELWESSGGDPTPAISADASADFGAVKVGEAASKTITVSGSNLKGAISVASDNTALVPSVSSISKDDAEKAGGYELTLTLTATAAGAGSAKVTLSSEDAASQTVNVSWTASVPMVAVSIEDAKKLAAESEVALNDVVVVRRFQDGLAFSVQDATGALNILDYGNIGTKWEEGDKISGITGVILSEGQDGFFTIFPYTGTVTASEVAVEPFSVSLSEFTKYGPASVKVTGISFPAEAEKFAAGGIIITQGGASANLQILEGCDIIGEDVPASADVVGVVCHPYATDNILLEESANLTNRVPKGGGTNIDNAKASKKATKTIYNGQLVIIKDGKMMNVLGAEL